MFGSCNTSNDLPFMNTKHNVSLFYCSVLQLNHYTYWYTPACSWTLVLAGHFSIPEVYYADPIIMTV